MSAEPMKLPPTERDFDIYHALVIEHETTRDVAAREGISKTRVIQLRKRVGWWIANEVPDLDELSPEKQLRLARYVAEERFYALYSESMSSWQRSQGVKTSERDGSSGPVKTTREEYGQPKFLQQALRVTVAQSTWSERQVAAAEQAQAAQAKQAEKQAEQEARKEQAKEEKAEAPRVFATPYVCPPPGYCPVLPAGEEPPCDVCPTMLAARAEVARGLDHLPPAHREYTLRQAHLERTVQGADRGGMAEHENLAAESS